MASVKALMGCMGIDTSGSVSVLGRFFGFLRARVPTDPVITVTASVSLLEQVRDVQDDHIHINVIQVGFDVFDADDTDDAWEKLDYATYRTRTILRTVGMGVGRVEHYESSPRTPTAPTTSAARPRPTTCPTTGRCTTAGSTRSSYATSRATSSGSPRSAARAPNRRGETVWSPGEIGRGSEAFSRTFAHEIGHFLDLSHNHGDDCPTTTAGQNNLMAQTRCALSLRDSVLLTSS